MSRPNANDRPKIVSSLTETFGFSPAVASGIATFTAVICVLAVVWFVRSIPPRALTIASGRPDSTFQRYAESYQKILATHGVKLRILPSEGSAENLERLQTAGTGADVALVQGGVEAPGKGGDIVSLGSVAFQPLWIFYRSDQPIRLLAELKGKRLSIGAPGSGTHSLALTLLQANGLSDTSATLLDSDAELAAQGLLAGKVDAVFLMGDSAPLQTLRTLVHSPGIRVYSFAQADAYVRRFPYLNKLKVPEGALDLGNDLPAEEVVLVGPTVDLVARPELNPALSDLLLEVAQEVHGKAGLLQKAGEFPAPLEHGLTISDDALRYYRSGKSFFYRAIGSFWLASLVNRTLVVFLPVLLVIFPTVRFLPYAYKWRAQLRFYQCYRRLLRLEKEAVGPLTGERRQDLLRRLSEIEDTVAQLKVPASIADQFYALRGHLTFVSDRLKGVPTPPA